MLFSSGHWNLFSFIELDVKIDRLVVSRQIIFFVRSTVSLIAKEHRSLVSLLLSTNSINVSYVLPSFLLYSSLTHTFRALRFG